MKKAHAHRFMTITITITNKIFKYLKLKMPKRKNTTMLEGAGQSIKRFFSQTLPASQDRISNI